MAFHDYLFALDFPGSFSDSAQTNLKLCNMVENIIVMD